MTAEQQRAVAEFVRRTITLAADFAALHSILLTSESRHEIPYGWQQTWEEMRRDVPYAPFVRAAEPLLAEIEAADSETVLIALLAKLATIPKPS